AGENVDLAAAAALPRRDRSLADPVTGRARLVDVEVQAGGARQPGWVVAVAAVDVEIGARPLFDRAGRRRIEFRRARRGVGARRAGQIADLRPPRELVRRAVGIVMVAVEVARLRTEWPEHAIVLLVTFFALIRVRD